MASKLIYQIKCDACGKMEHIDVKYFLMRKKLWKIPISINLL